jgi:hypothetical protein
MRVCSAKREGFETVRRKPRHCVPDEEIIGSQLLIFDSGRAELVYSALPEVQEDCTCDRSSAMPRDCDEAAPFCNQQLMDIEKEPSRLRRKPMLSASAAVKAIVDLNCA